MDAERRWTNSPMGRVACTVFGIVTVVIAVSNDFGRDAGGGFSVWVVLGETLIILIGVGAVVAAWTSSLVLCDGTLTATNFFVSRSMPLVEVVAAKPVDVPWLGIKIRASDGSGIRTLVSGSSTRGWGARAERISEEIVALAEAARRGTAWNHRRPVVRTAPSPAAELRHAR